MKRLFVKFLSVPVGIYVISMIIGFLVINVESPLFGFLSGYAVGFPLLTIVWWFIALSRWLNNEYYWETIPFIISNLAVGFGIAILGLVFGVGIYDFSSSVSVLLVFGAMLGGIIWIFRSLYVRVFKRNWNYDSIHMLPLEFELTSLALFTRFLSSHEEKTIQSSPKKQKRRKKRTQKTKSSIFRSVNPFSSESSNDSGSIPIPPRGTPRPSHNVPKSKSVADEVYRPMYEVVTSSYSTRSDFVSEAKKYVNRTEKQAEPVPFMQYWPTYSSMSKAQQKWYFYWRTQLRQGVRLPTDTSYLFVYIYEVINLIGFDAPKDAFDHLVKFWGYYRKLQPKLDNYLPDWIADFIIIHKLPIEPLKWYGKIAKMGRLGDEDLLIEAWLQSDDGYDVLSNDIIYRLANYNPTKSKFYKQQGTELDLDAAYKKGIEAVDNYVRKETGKSLFEIHQSARTRVIKRRPFVSAVHDYPDTEIEIATVHFWYGNEALGETLKNIVKHTENVIRGQNNYRHKLRDIDLDAKWETAIESAFIVVPPKREVEIDLSQVAQLKEESEAIRERLVDNSETEKDDSKHLFTPDEKARILAEFEAMPESDQIKFINRINERIEQLFYIPRKADNDSDKPDVQGFSEDKVSIDTTVDNSELFEPDRQLLNIDIDSIKHIQAESEAIRDKLIIEDNWLEPNDAPKVEKSQEKAIGQGYLLRPDDTSDDLLTDLPEVAAIMGESASSASKVISVIMKNDWKCSTDIIQVKLDGQFANVIIDQINEKSFGEIGDTLIFEEDDKWVILEEYRDEIQYILNHPEYQQRVIALTKPTEIYAELDEEWAEFVDYMKPHHWDALAAILSSEDVDNRVNVIAMLLHQTGNILIDEINEFANESMGDIIIDTANMPPSIVEDELANITDLLSWAASRQIIEV